MILLRRVIGDALRARRQAQHRTLREVSTAANVSLGYLSEIERGQKEASSELLAAVCDALGARLSELLHEVSSTVASSERGESGSGAPERGGVPERGRVPEQGRPATDARESGAAERSDVPEPARADASEGDAQPAMAGAAEARAAAEPALVGPAVGARPALRVAGARGPAKSAALAASAANRRMTPVASASVSTTVDGQVALTIRRDTPLSTTLRTRTIRRDVLSGV
jgi:transcriptional regulator with XRE-family HTH domain